MLSLRRSLWILSLSLISSPAWAEMPLAIGVDAGTAGFGLQLHAGLSERINLRAGYNHLSGSEDVDAEDNNGVQGDELRYSGDLTSNQFSLLADFYPWAGLFHITAGAVLNDTDLKVDAKCQNSAGCEVGEGDGFLPSQLGTITTDIDFNKFGPYVGIGWGNPVKGEAGWHWSFELGVLYLGEPSVEMRASGDCGVFAAQCRQALDDEAKELEDDLSDLRFYPVAQLGLSYRFR